MNIMTVMTMFCCIIFCLSISRTVAQECPADRAKQWSYQPNFPNGPSHWGDNFPGCNGKSQSPINIERSKLSRAMGRQKLKLNGYDTPITKVRIENDGHTIGITPKDNVKRSMMLDNEKYNLDSFHFHWGNQTSKGSEHEINGQKYTMEAHFVHMNDKDEIAVVGVFFEERFWSNSALVNILSVMSSYMYEGEAYEATISRFSFNPYRWGEIYLEDLVDDGCSYYRYNGSLTTPPCTENVKWLLCKSNKHVGSSQMNQLFSLYSVPRGTGNEEKCHLINNYRPIQPLNGRKIYA